MIGHGGMMWGFGGWWMMIFWVLIIIGIIYLVRWAAEKRQSNEQTSQNKESPLDILKRRYARGEIDQEEFETKKKVLE